MSHIADTLIRLPAFVDQLDQPGLRSRAVEHDVGRHGRRRIGGAARKKITVARLTVEQRHGIGERCLRRDLTGGLAVIVEDDS